MKVLIQLAFAATAIATAIPKAVSDASPLGLVKRAVSPDGTCGVLHSGNGKGYSCPTGWTKCCSEWGWCGDSAEHCGAGCQSAYGICNGGGSSPTTTTTTTSGPVPTTPPSNIPYGQFIYNCNINGKFVLTFDDGPYDFTQTLLNTLSAQGVKATFFVNGQNWGAPITDAGKVALVKRMINEGHQVGSHTWSHPDLSTLSVSNIQTEMVSLDNALRNIINKAPTYMRPPYFSCNSQCLNTLGLLGYHIIHANLDTNDWQLNTGASIAAVQNAVNAGSPSSNSFLTLLHDVHSGTVNSIVPSIISIFKNAGYTSATVGECLGDPAASWYRN